MAIDTTNLTFKDLYEYIHTCEVDDYGYSDLGLDDYCLHVYSHKRQVNICLIEDGKIDYPAAIAAIVFDDSYTNGEHPFQLSIYECGHPAYVNYDRAHYFMTDNRIDEIAWGTINYGQVVREVITHALTHRKN